MAVNVASGGIADLGDVGPDKAPAYGNRLLKYNPREVKLIFGGLPVHIGAAAGTFITIERTKPSYKLLKGTDGEGTRIRTQDFSSTLRLTIRKGSGINDALSELSAADDLTGAVALPLYLTDWNGRSRYIAPIAFLEQPVDTEFSTEEGANTWTFLCDTWLPFTGGLNYAMAASPPGA